MARGGFPPRGGGNMNQMMKQMKKMQQQMAEMEANMAEQEMEISTGGGMVKVVVNGKKELVRISIDPEVVDPEDVGMLEDLILTAVNQAMEQADTKANEAMQKLTGGLNIPGL